MTSTDVTNREVTVVDIGPWQRRIFSSFALARVAGTAIGSGQSRMKPRISMITLGVRDLGRAVEFYGQGLGFPQMDSPPEVAFFTLNGTWLGLYGREALAEDAGVSADGGGFGGFALAHNVSSESEVDAVLDLAVAAGGTLVKRAEKVFWGGYRGYFSDPDGHLWEVAHNPLFWVGPADDETR